MAHHLSVLPAPYGAEGPPCAACAALCCRGCRVAAEGYDLYRLVRGLGLPWEVIAEVAAFPDGVARGFHLGGAAGHLIYLRRREQEGEARCHFLLELGGHLRCGVYELRPGACRVYPLVAADYEPHGAWVWGMSRCAGPLRERFRAALPGLRGLVEEDTAESRLYERVLERWNGQPFPTAGLGPGDYVAWLLRAYDAIAPLRQGPPASWLPAAARRIATLPLP